MKRTMKKEEYLDDDSLNPNPFKTYYFPIDDIPYEMKYRPDGKFENSFKSGLSIPLAVSLPFPTYPL